MADPLSREILLSQGSCCGKGCYHCPYWPLHEEGSISLSDYKIEEEKDPDEF